MFTQSRLVLGWELCLLTLLGASIGGIGSVGGGLLRADEPAATANPDSSPAAPSPGDTGRPEDYPEARPGGQRTSDKLTPAELKQLAAQGRIRKLVDQKFRRQPRDGNRFERVSPEDSFVAARFEMPLATGMLEVRFEVLTGTEAAVQQITDYLLATPAQTVRDFFVVSRFRSPAEADEGLAAARRQYDEARAYQAQLAAYLQAQQQVQVQSMRRC